MLSEMQSALQTLRAHYPVVDHVANIDFTMYFFTFYVNTFLGSSELLQSSRNIPKKTGNWTETVLHKKKFLKVY